MLCENDWVSLMVVRKPDAGVNGYVYSRETRCRGRIVAVLPYQDTAAGREYLVKSEMTPCWGFDQVLSAITGGWEDGDIEDDAVREMLEETGYAITRDELIPLGESFASKSADTVYSLFSVNLTGREAGEAIGDGTRLESESAAVWVDAAVLAALRDPQLAVMWMRIQAGATREAPDRRTVLCPGCLHDGALERQMDRALAAEANLAGIGTALREHYLAGIGCDHARKEDNPVCACSRVFLGWHTSKEAAVTAWVEHVMEVAGDGEQG